MIPASFEYKRPGTVAEALDMLKADGGAKLLAGGHSLIPALKLRLNQPASLIDISRIAELKVLRDRGSYIAIGGGVTHGEIANSKMVQSKLNWFATTAAMIGDVQVRNMGTIGGAIAHADPAADWPAVLIAANATIEVKGPYGERHIPAGEFFKGFFYTALGENEMVTEVHVPEPDKVTVRSCYNKFAQPASRFALAACAVQLTLGNEGVIKAASVAFNGVSSSAYRAAGVEKALIGKTLNADTAAAAAVHATEGAEMIMSDHYADEAYRTSLAQTVCKRAILGCMYE